MKIPQAVMPVIRTVILLTFIAAMLVALGAVYIGAGGKIPLVTDLSPYTVTLQSPINKNLVNQSQVTLNGVPAGRVEQVDVQGGVAMVSVSLSEKPEFAPLHQGLQATVKTKTLINETYIDIQDGTGPPLPDKALIPATQVAPPVDTDEVIRALPQSDRTALGGALQGLDKVTSGNQAGISQTVGSLGEPTNYVPAVLKALNDQEASLRQLSTNTARVLGALDTGQGQIAELVQNADTITKVTAGSREDLSNVIRKLTPTLQTAQGVSGDLSRLGFALQPVADNLNRSAKPLNAALAELPPTSRDLRSLLPYLDQTLAKAPPTLQRVPRFSHDVINLVPAARGAFDQLNPILAYLRPCAPNIVPFIDFTDGTNDGTSPGGPLGRVALLFGLDNAQLPVTVPPITPINFGYRYTDSCKAPVPPLAR